MSCLSFLHYKCRLRRITLPGEKRKWIWKMTLLMFFEDLLQLLILDYQSLVKRYRIKLMKETWLKLSSKRHQENQVIRYMLLSIDLPVDICTLLKFFGKAYLQFWWKSVLQEEKKSLQNLKPCFLHFLKTWALCKVNFVNTKKLLQMFTLCGLMCSLSPVSLIGRWASLPCRNGNLCVERKLDFCIFKQEKELETLSTRSAEQVADIRKLQAVVWYVTVTFSCHSYLKKQENIRVKLLKCHQLVLNSVFLLKVPNSIFSYMQKIFFNACSFFDSPNPSFLNLHVKLYLNMFMWWKHISS